MISDHDQACRVAPYQCSDGQVVGQYHIYIYIPCMYMIILAGKSTTMWSYTVYIDMVLANLDGATRLLCCMRWLYVPGWLESELSCN